MLVAFLHGLLVPLADVTQQEALWFDGGNLHQSRHYSLYLALQLKAREASIPAPVYGLQEVHHRS